MDEARLFEELTQQLDRWERRHFWSECMLWLPRGILAGLIAAAFVASIARLQPVLYNREVALVSLGLALLGLVLSFAAVLSRRRPLLEQARFFDRLFGLEERITAAVEIRAGQLPTTASLAEEQLADAAQAAAGVDSNNIRLGPRWLDLALILLAGTLLLMAVLMPNPWSALLDEQQAVAESIASQAEELEALQQRLREEPALTDAGRQELLEPIESALRELNSSELSREQAVAVLSEAEAELRELTEANNSGRIAEVLSATAELLGDNPMTQTLGQALSSGDFARAGGAVNQLADALASMPALDSSTLAQNLEQAAAALRGVDAALAQVLAEAAEALDNGNIESAQQALREAAAALQQRALEQARSVQAQAAADRLQEARDQVASAGTAGEGMAAGAGNESGTNGADAGQSSQGQEAGTGQMDNQGAGQASEEGQGTGGPGPGGGHAESVFVPNLVDLSGEAGVDVELPAECVANPENCGALLNETATEFGDEESLVPYEQVFGDYRNAAFEALEGDYVPFGLKDLVRDYFSLLEP